MKRPDGGLQEGAIAGGGLDVLEVEPLDPDNPLLKMENVILTPHSSYYSDAAVQELPFGAPREVGRVLTGRMPLNLFNRSGAGEVAPGREVMAPPRLATYGRSATVSRRGKLLASHTFSLVAYGVTFPYIMNTALGCLRLRAIESESEAVGYS